MKAFCVLGIALFSVSPLFAQMSFPPKGASLIEQRREKGDFPGARPYTVHKYSIPVKISEQIAWPCKGVFKRRGCRIDPVPDVNAYYYDNYFLQGVVASFESQGTSWTARFAVLPTLEASVEFGEDELVRVPDKKSVTITGTANGEQMRGLLVPGVIYDLKVNGGRVVALRAGDWSEPALTDPHFIRGDLLSFRFTAKGVDGLPRKIETTPTYVEGGDVHDYDMVSRVGGMSGAGSVDPDGYVHYSPDGWSIYVFGSTQAIFVAAAMASERGGDGGVAMEAIGPSKAALDEIKVTTSAGATAPPPTRPWVSLSVQKLGPVPSPQRTTARNASWLDE